ncbi:MAG TPA: NADH-quinone oxidoreductase subunit NuoH [Dehalococcoidia bacterium]|nr:NADH-quinone oxidoreductase subunit NuoH [Dehalococcoidia bacterium]
MSLLLSIISHHWYDVRDLSNITSEIRSLLGDAGAPGWTLYVVTALLGTLGIIAFIGGVAIINIWIERRVVGRMQSRLGPNRLGPFGLLQPVADAIKLMQKEVLQPRVADGLVFSLAPIAFTVPGIIVLAVVPWGPNMALADLNVGVLYILAMSSLGALAVFIGGYGSNNKYALFGSMRVIAMLVTYEIPSVLSLLGLVLFSGTMNLSDMVLFQQKYWIPLLLVQPLPFIIYFIASSAELNRTPADLAEAESEIAGGYHVEYSGMKFGLFYAAELINAVAISAIIATVFLGGWWFYRLDEIVPGWIIFIGKIYAVYFLFVWTRGTLPRFRIDQLLAFAWKWMTPMAFLNIVLVAAEILIWDETGASAGIVLPIYAVVNTAFAALLIFGWVKLMSPKFSRFPDRLRMYSRIDVPSLPANAMMSAVPETGEPDGSGGHLGGAESPRVLAEGPTA